MTDLAALTAWSVLTHVWDEHTGDWRQSGSYHGQEVGARKHARQVTEALCQLGGLHDVTLLTHAQQVSTPRHMTLHRCRIVHAWRVEDGVIRADW